MKQPQTDPVNATYTQERIVAGLRKPENWAQLVQFGLVGASGFVINQAIFLSCYHALHIRYPIAYVLAFLVAFSNNFIWNRHWTFAGQKGSFALQGVRFYVVSIAAFAVNQLWLAVFLDWLHWGKVVSQALAIVLVTPLNFLGNKLWSFRA